ncbi:polysaccharide biosynthesis protein [Sulfitobacter sp. SK012]|uniref:oligosaccharide flippase family protein n=1 Tax=Sulfitobacter sp. SK012 TaxID=1389005 RepID=UPI000E0C8D4D|nr:polysaccharide biosynthesis protein [Sulfitobacter sp. SK012]
MQRVSQLLKGNRLMARVLRSASWIVLGYGASQAIRLASNLILTRLLFPEAFGVMTLITLVTVGLALFSDVGISPSIAQSKRGDDPDFLNTAWTIQVGRGVALWLVAMALAWPAARFYDAPSLIYYLPLAAVGLLIAGFNPTRIETAHRHLLLGRLTALDLVSQVIGIVAMISLALAWPSVGALVVGNLIGILSKLALVHWGMPGLRNRFRWEMAAVIELVTFGKWIFLSTIFWFFASQGDRVVLGKFLPLEELGIYNIGYFLASFPLLLGLSVAGRIMIPIYREQAGETHKVTRMRYVLTGGVMGMQLLMALLGPWLVQLLYDSRYFPAGAILTLVSVALIPQVIGMTYDQAALASGDSRRFFIFSAIRSIVQFGLLLIGAFMGGLVGAMIGMWTALVLSHLVLIWLARAHGVWDMRHDLMFAVVAVLISTLALWLHWGSIVELSAGVSG